MNHLLSASLFVQEQVKDNIEMETEEEKKMDKNKANKPTNQNSYHVCKKYKNCSHG